jgi:hypothetical protein
VAKARCTANPDARKNRQTRSTSKSLSRYGVISLVATGSWKSGANEEETKELLAYLISRKKSAGLRTNNPFTTAWILEAVTALETTYSDLLDDKAKDQVAEKEKILQKQIKAGRGGVSMKPYATVARQELDAIKNADVLIVLLPGGYGTHVEIGAALALGKPVILHSPDRETLNKPYPCVFHYHPGVKLIVSEVVDPEAILASLS